MLSLARKDQAIHAQKAIALPVGDALLLRKPLALPLQKNCIQQEPQMKPPPGTQEHAKRFREPAHDKNLRINFESDRGFRFSGMQHMPGAVPSRSATHAWGWSAHAWGRRVLECNAFLGPPLPGVQQTHALGFRCLECNTRLGPSLAGVQHTSEISWSATHAWGLRLVGNKCLGQLPGVQQGLLLNRLFRSGLQGGLEVEALRPSTKPSGWAWASKGALEPPSTKPLGFDFPKSLRSERL